MSCILPVSFTPSTTGTLTGSLALTDNALNAIAPEYTTQVIALSGVATGSTAQTITFGAIPSQSAVTSLGLTATATSGLPVGFASGTPSVCSVSGVTASLLTAGTCSITASQPGNSVYAPATPVAQGFTVNLAAQTITFNPIANQILNTSAPVPLTATASSGLSVSDASTTPSVCTASGSSVSLLTAGTCTIQANQPGDGVVYAAAATVSQSFTVGTIIPMTATSFGSVNIGTASSAVAVTVALSAAGTLGSAAALTGSVTGLDFATAAGGSCTAGTSYNVGDTCTVNVTFTPTLSGIRYGAVVLPDSSGNLLGTAYVQGTGVGPQIAFTPGAESPITSSAAMPEGIAVDAGGSLYIVGNTNDQVLKETKSAGSYTESTIPVSYLTSPTSVAVDASGAVYIADSGDDRILLEAPSGSSYAETVVPTSALNGPAGVAVDGSGNVYVADTGNNRVLIEALSNGTYTESTIPTSTLNGPSSVAVDGSGDVYILDAGNNRVLVESLSNGSYSENTVPTSSLNGPSSLTVDADGDIYIADFGNNRILKETPSRGSYVETTVSSSSLNLPYGVAADSSGNVYIADTYNDRVLKEDFVDPPSLSFLPAAPGTTSGDSPQTVTVENVGNAALTLSVPASGNNPGISANFALNSSGPSACPLVIAGGSGPATIGAGQSCLLPISFIPTSTGDFTGTLSIADNALNGNATQTIQLSGTGTGSTAQTIAFGAISAQTVNSTVALTATSSSGLTVTFSSTTPSICTISGTTASLLAAGICSIQASQPGSSVYAAAAPVTQNFTVNLAAQTITFLSIPNQVENQSVGVVLTAAASSALPVSFASDTPSVCTVSGATASLLTAGTYTIEANQAGDGVVYAAAPTVTQSFGVETVNPVTGRNLGSVNIGATSSIVPVTMMVSAAGTLGSISALTQGVTGLDFASTSGGSCTTGNNYSIGDTCTANVTFTPTLAGVRYGAVVLDDGSGSIMATAYIQGAGVGPQVDFLPGTESVVSSDLSGPQGVAVDGSGNLYLADTYNNRVLKETLASGIYTESTISTSSLNSPSAVAVDGSGVLYVLDSGNSRVLKETLVAGAYLESTVSTSSLSWPDGIAVDESGNIYIADSGNNRVLLESPSNGTYTETPIPTSALNGPNGVAVDSLGDVYIADTGNNRVLRENLVSGAYNEAAISTSPLNTPIQIALDSEGDIYIVDSYNYRVLKETPQSSTYTESTVATSLLGWPFGVAADGAGNIYVADSGTNRFLKEDLADAPTLNFASTAPGSTSSDSPQIVTLENYGNATLAFPVSGSDNNPSISNDFTLNSSGPSACPLVTSGASGPATLGAGQSCTLPVSFSPSETGTFNGSLAISDNSLNSTTSQTIQLNGAGTNSDMARREQPLDGGCPQIPTIINVSPATWFAGKTYHVTITGYNFSTGWQYCNSNYNFAPPVVQVTSSKNSVTVLSQQILSDTIIQATIQVGDQEPTATAQLSVGILSLAFGPIRPALKVTTIDQPQYKATMAPVQILAIPQIKWNGDYKINDPACPLTKNDVLSGSASPCAVVGQKIALTTDVATEDGKGNITLPGGLSVTKNVWTFDTVAIGGYTVIPPPVPPEPSTPLWLDNASYGTVMKLKSDDPTATAYWLDAPGGTAIHTAKYHYCVPIPGGISPLDPPDNNCSSDATARFSVSGPTNIEVIVGATAFAPDFKLLPTMNWYSSFNGHAEPPSPYPGQFLWVQTVNDILVKGYNNRSSQHCGIGQGLDTIFPMKNGLQTFDTPQWYVGDPGEITLNRHAVFWSYLMWSADSTPINIGSIINQDDPYIPVPLQVVNWRIDGTLSSGPWRGIGRTKVLSIGPTTAEPEWSIYETVYFVDKSCTP
jgi:sugar lactone lactonase YvrE